jgi:organic radical activating enzyme
MNRIKIDINRIEFAVTKGCSGKCKHCSADVSETASESINAETAVNAVKQLTGKYTVKSMLTFGGEPLLYPDTVYALHEAARDGDIKLRQIITNGFFSRDENKIEQVAKSLSASGVNEVLLSVDAFHQEYIPVEPVLYFAKMLLKHGIPELYVHPAWLVDKSHKNPYNDETHRLLKPFNDMGIETSNGNNVSPRGSALKYFSEYFTRPETVDLSVPCGQLPYTGRLDDVGCVYIGSDGGLYVCSIVIGNIYENEVLDILGKYNPYDNPATRALMEGGVKNLIDYAEGLGIKIDISDCYSACGVCRKTIAALKEQGLA